MRNFDVWLSTFRASIADYAYYTDFQNVYRNTELYRIELNLLNSLIGSRDIKQDFLSLLARYPECLKAVPILLAKREQEIFCMDAQGSFTYTFARQTLDAEQYAYFMEQTGLFDLIQSHVIANLFDYVLGVNAGLDSNGRKNRGGHLMEDLCERFIRATGMPYRKEVNIQDIEQERDLDLGALTNNGEVTKRFDFAVWGQNTVYGVECNFYASGGSKLNETARSYKNIALEAGSLPGFKFVWITDGEGWKKARHNLKETFDVLDDLYNIAELEAGVLDRILR